MLERLVGDMFEFQVNLFLAIFGLMGSWLLEIYRDWKQIADLKLWLKDNIIRGLLSVFAILCGIMFSDDLLGLPLNDFTAFLAGFCADKTINSLINRKQ